MNINISKDLSKNPIVSSMKESSHSLVEGLILAIVIILFYVYIVSPKKASLAAINTERQKYVDEQTTLKSNIQQMESLISKMKSSPDAIRHLDESMPLDGKTIYLQLLMEKLARDAGVSATEINFSVRNDRATAGDKALLANPFGIKRATQVITGTVFVVGTFDQLEAFMKKLESSGRLMNITDFEIASSQPDSLDLKLDLETYYYE